jgi:hypothetical protein
VITTIIFCAALAGLGLITFLVADGRRDADPDRQRRLRIRARASELQAEAVAQDHSSDSGDPEEERAAIESRLEQERRRTALIETSDL